MVQNKSTIDESYEEDGECDDSLQATIDQLIEVGGQDNIKETWKIKVGIVCKHYFQVMLNTQEAKFHFNSTSATIESGVVNNYLCAIDKEKSLRLIEILENFTNEDSSDDEVESDDEFEEELDDVDDRNNEEGFQLQNPKIR
ncbi:hypothetical protein RhiirB3_428340 [Rhizophagus irregularis]|nr:hypothetical protein RhiirB3_428340 [Rhizophagus irregularis]